MNVYPKTYATVVSFQIQAKKAGIGQMLRLFSSEEWAIISKRQGKRQYHRVGRILKIKTDAGEELTLNDHEIKYDGKGNEDVDVGLRIKMWHHPKDARAWRYKLTGE